jgi:hypothetical protein
MPTAPNKSRAGKRATHSAAWNQQPQVASPVGRTVQDLLETRPRRQQLQGFEPVYSDIVDYIIRCTHRIWEEKNVGLCRTHYAADCKVHTLSGTSVGVDPVVQGTVAALASCIDRNVIAEDVIWSEDAPGLFLSSHRIVSYATQLGDDAMFGSATGRLAGVMTIADCLVRENLIVEEWLVRDNLRAARQLQLDPWQVARAQAAADQAGSAKRHGWRAEAIAELRRRPRLSPPAEHPAAAIAHAVDQAFNEDLYGLAAQLLSPSVEVRWPSGRFGYGRGFWIGCLMQLRASLANACWRLEHFAARPLPDDQIAVALRWSLTGRHDGAGIWGEPSHKNLLLMGVSHFRLRHERIVEDATVFDELAVLRQIVGGLGA